MTRHPARPRAEPAPAPTGPAAPLALAAVALAGAVLTAWLARTALVAHSFPVDDAWIHLTYARTLKEHGAFAFFPGDPTTGGSTSPLFTLILAAGFFLTRNEILLGCAVGIVFHAAFLFLLGTWARRITGSVILGAGVALALAVDTRVATLSAAGMETSLFLLLVVAACAARTAGARRLSFACLGLAVWTRPDGAILAAVFLIDDVIHPAQRRDLLAGWGLFGALVVAYLAFNVLTGHSLLPNTFAAKTRAYAHMGRHRFLVDAVVRCFFEHGWRILTTAAIVGCVIEGVRALQRRDSPLRSAAGFALALPLAYYAMLPFAHRFERYLVPALPFIALLGVATLQEVARRVDRRAHVLVPALALVATITLQIRALPAARRDYATWCNYHRERHVRTGEWLREHTPANAVIGAQDIGAIAYYSHRRIIDLLGLATPEVIPHLGQADYTKFLESLLTARHVRYIATLRSWIEVVNVRPVYTADPVPEVLEVYQWIPGRTHIVPEDVTAMNDRGTLAARDGRLDEAIETFRASVARDSLDSRTWALLGVTYDMQGDATAAEDAYRRSSALFPEDASVRFGLARLLARTRRVREAREQLRAVLMLEPAFPGAQDLLNQLR